MDRDKKCFLSMVQRWWLNEGEKINLRHGIAYISTKTSLFLFILSPNDGAERVDAFGTLKCDKWALIRKVTPI